MLLPIDYGRYSLVISVAGVLNIIFCEWFRYGLIRFYPESIAAGEQKGYLLFVKHVVIWFTITIATTTLISFLLSEFFFQTIIDKWLILVIGLMLFLNFTFNLFTQIVVTELRPYIFSNANLIKAVVGVGISMLMIYLGYTYVGLFIGVALGFMFAVVYAYFNIQFTAKAHNYKFNGQLLKDMVFYSLPITASAGLSFLVSYSSRFMIGYFKGVEETGLFTLGYDFTQQTIGVFIGIAATSSLPIAMKLYTENGEDSAFKLHMNRSIQMLFLIALPIVMVFWGNYGEIISLLLGKNFKRIDPMLIPVSALAAFILGIKGFYLDTVFYLKKETKFQTLILFTVVIIDTLLNIVFVPQFGYIASAYANLVVSIIAITLTYIVVNRLIKTPVPWLDIIKIIICVIAMFVFYKYSMVPKSFITLCLKIGIGLIIFIVLFAIVNKKMVLQFIRQKSNTSIS